MGALRFNLGIAASVLLLAGVYRADGQTPSATPATQPAGTSADIEIGKPTKYPMLITPLMEGGVLRDSHHGPELTVQEFEFNPATHELGLAKNTPAAHRIYGNSRIDSAAYNSDLDVFDYLNTDRSPIGKIVLTCAKKKIMVSYNYVVSPAKDEPVKIDPSTYCAAVQFVKGDECNKPGTTVTFHRNDEKPTAIADTTLSKINRKTDLITWTIERNGATVKTGSFGFPVVATEPDLVKYVIALP